MTANKEDYIKAIYKLGGERELVPNKPIAEQLGIAAPSVTEMLTRLAREGFIAYTPYKGSILTDKGLASCIRVVRSHRLWEVFLMRHLGYSWSEAHEDAHLLEHTAPPRLVERLDRFLNFPACCPHGSVIPSADGSADLPELVPLTALAVGDTSCIRRVTEEAELLDYLEPLGFAVGEAFTVKSRALYEGPVTLTVKDAYDISISYKAAGKIFVDPA